VPDIAGFRALTYDPTRVDLNKVVTPPYDVIDAAERARLAARDPHNFVHLDLPEAKEGEDRYRHAASTMTAWQADGILRRDTSRAVFRYHQVFESAELGRTITRKGMVAALRLHPWSDGVVKPHERTLRGPKEDRMKLLEATRTHLSQVFATFSDASGEIERILRQAENARPTLEARTDDGTLHRVWRIADAEKIGKLRHQMASKELYILDGHHRYETMNAFRDRFVAEGNDLAIYSSLNYGPAFLVSGDDPGLVILPTHRVVHGIDGFAKDKFLAGVSKYFRVDKIAGAARDAAKVRDALSNAFGHAAAVAAVFPGDPDAYLLTLDPHVDPAAEGMSGHKAVIRLDVAVLHGLVMERVLGISKEAQEAQTNLKYVKDTAKTLDLIAAGEGQVGLLMNPPTLDQVKHVADLGEVMPQKSTYFFPKLASGLILMPVDADEDLV
jgi:uncharacterized protein (DUF1015 family)